MNTAQIIAIGNEVLIGRTVDTNSNYLASRLYQLGIQVIKMTVIPDVREVILKTLAETEADIVLTTGGLGATIDDITRKTIAEYFNCDLIIHTPTLDRLHAFYAKRGQQINNISAKMALVPARAIPLDNDVGAAPGLQFAVDKGRTFFCMPGVPYEVKDIFEKRIIPFLKQRYSEGFIRQEIFRTVGIPESKMAQLIEDIENELPEYISLAYNPSLQALDMRLVLQTTVVQAPEHEIIYNKFIKKLGERIAPYVFGKAEDTLEGKIGEKLVHKKLTIATAESCTGGGLMARLVSVSGSSRYVKGGMIAYSNEVKKNELGVMEATLAEHGAVSEECAIEMARGIRKKLNTDLALSVTGIAGPDGGTPTKPVGLVWIGFADADRAYARSFQFEQDRNRNIERTIISALNLLRLELMER